MVWVELPRLRRHRNKVLVFRRSKALRDFRRSFGFRRDLSDIPVLRLSSSGFALLLLATKLFESLSLIIRECAEFRRSVVTASLELPFYWLALLGRRPFPDFPSLLLLGGVLFCRRDGPSFVLTERTRLRVLDTSLKVLLANREIRVSLGVTIDN
jgi:hypothetical protein